MIAILILAFVVAALILGVVEIIQTRGQSLVAWGVVLLSAAILIWRYN